MLVTQLKERSHVVSLVARFSRWDVLGMAHTVRGGSFWVAACPMDTIFSDVLKLLFGGIKGRSPLQHHPQLARRYE